MRFPAYRGAAVVALLVSLSSHPALAQVAPGEAACAALRQLQVPGAALSEVTTEWFAASSAPPQEPPWVPPLAVPLPAYCKLSATLDRRIGADGRSYGIGFALAYQAVGRVAALAKQIIAQHYGRPAARSYFMGCWPGRSRPLCPYPSHAHYKGTGDVEDAASFECR